MKKIGIITIHKIYNYGSVLQAYALQNVCESMGYIVEIIDYKFPNEYHRAKSNTKSVVLLSFKEKLIKYLFLWKLYLQHKLIRRFVYKYLNLSKEEYLSPQQLKDEPPIYDIYITGSDQVWNPRYCCGDTSFLLDFVRNGKKISYSASIGSSDIDKAYYDIYSIMLEKYAYISVREKSGRNLVERLTRKSVEVVLDPTLLLTAEQWNRIATNKSLVKGKYILCYFLNYSFNAFPYVYELAEYMQKEMDCSIVWVARPPYRMNRNIIFYVEASPEDFLALIRDSEMVLTTSFHGTAFAINYSKPLFSVVEDKNALDSRQIDLLSALSLDNRILSLGDKFPDKKDFVCDYEFAKEKLKELRIQSYSYLKNSLAHV